MDPNVLEYVSSGGPVVVMLLVFGMIIKGELVTKRHLEDTQADRDVWRDAYRNERDARIKESSAAQAAMISGQVATQLLDEIRNRQRTD